MDRTIAPDYHAIENINIQKVEERYLSNKVPLFSLVNMESPVLRVQFIFDAGKWWEHRPGVSFFMANMLQEGTVSLSSAEIAAKISHYGAFLEIIPGNDRMVVTWYLLEKHLNQVIELMHDLLFEPVFPEEELKKLQRQSLQKLKINKEKTSYLAEAELKETFFGTSYPYGSTLNEDQIAAINVNDLKNFHTKQVMGKPFEIMVSGCFSIQHFKLLDTYFGKVQLSGLNESVNHTKQRMEPGLYRVKKPESLQASIRVAKECMRPTDEDYMAFLVTNELFGGYFGSRLMKNIREDKGYTYGIRSSIRLLKNDAYWVVSTDVKGDVANNTLDEISRELDQLKTEPISLREIETVKNYMLGGFCAATANVFDQTDKFKFLRYAGLDYSYYENYVLSLNAVEAEDIRRIAIKYLDWESMLKVVVG